MVKPTSREYYMVAVVNYGPTMSTTPRALQFQDVGRVAAMAQTLRTVPSHVRPLRRLRREADHYAALGEEAESVLSSTNATEDDRKDYAAVITNSTSTSRSAATSFTSEPDSITEANNLVRQQNSLLWPCMS